MNRIANVVFLFLCFAAGCGGEAPARHGVGPTAAVVSILPKSLVLPPGAMQHFSATVSPTSDDSVSWSVLEGAGGGTISNDGLYQAPPIPGTAHVVATSKADSTRSAMAEVTITGLVAVFVEPSSKSLAAGLPLHVQFTATVMGTPDGDVTWSVQEGGSAATVDGSGMFTSTGEPGVFHVVATSHADPAKSASATVTVAYSTDMIDHGGPVVPATRTFLVFWGDASAFPADARDGLETLLRGLQGSSYLSVLDQYLRGASATTAFGGTLFDSSAPPADPTQVVGDAVCRALAANGIAPRPGDFVLVTSSNFPSSMTACAWHDFTTCNGQIVLYAYAPNPTGSRCGNSTDACGTGYSSATTDLLLSASHELFESMTDPSGKAWLSSVGFEVMDGCGFTICPSLSTGTVPAQAVYSNAAHDCVSH